DRARTLLETASGRLDAPHVRLAAAVPLLGRSLDAERDVARAGSSAADAVAVLAAAVPGVRANGGVDVEALRLLSQRLGPLGEQAAADMAELRSAPTALTPPFVAAGVRDARQALGPVVAGLDSADEGARLAAALLGGDGPRNLLVALGNNAELRGTGGYVATFATGRAAGGRLAIDPFKDVLSVYDPPGRQRKVPAPPEYVEDYGASLADTTLFREWTMSPDVPDAASVAAGAAGLLLGRTPDLVVLLDVPALAGVVRAAGTDVTLPDGTVVTADELTEALLVDSYAAAGEQVQEQDARRAALRAAAGATVSRLLTGDTAALPLVRELGRLARGRHFAVWSARPPEQQELERLGLAGSADPEGDDLSLVSVNNLSVNKLDYYVQRTVEVSATVGLEAVDVVQRVILENRAPDGLVPYVVGLDTPERSSERVEFSFAADAEFVSLREDGAVAEGGVREGGERRRAFSFVDLGQGERTELELRYRVPVEGGRYRLHLVPQALARDADLRVEIEAADGLTLAQVVGASRAGDVAVRQGPWSERELVEVRVARPSLWQRLRG
ncbi:MAG: putative rane protein, partial [Frankiales bacterium]|nr:putative rane protein [Frankiales bacterium]